MPPSESRSLIVQQLRRDIGRIERSSGVDRPGREAVPTGVAPLDRLLPDGGWRRGGLVECLTSGAGCGAETLVFSTLPRLVSAGRALLVVDGAGTFHPPAAHRLGVDLARTIVLRPRRMEDALWAIEQAQRCPGVAAVVAWAEALNNVVFRRLQLAAEAGAGTSFLFRPARHRAQPSWADVRLAFEPLPSEPRRSKPPSSPSPSGSASPSPSSPPSPPSSSRPSSPPSRRGIRVELVHFRGGAAGDVLDLEIDEETAAVRLASRLADTTPAWRKAGA